MAIKKLDSRIACCKIPPVRFSIITPSFNSSPWLKLCLASVADQGVALEHIVQDAGSTDGTLDWLRQDNRVKLFVERDGGMYDAINRGLRRANGEILAYLNCDEQYLPGCLQTVEKFFLNNPLIDVVFGHSVVVDSELRYLFHRKVQVPLKYHTWVSHLSTLTCATFFRRKILDERGLFFDARLRGVGDGEWMLRLLQNRVPMSALRQFTSVFTVTGVNMSARPNAIRERRELQASAPFWARKLKSFLVLHHRLRRLAGGIYFQGPFSFSIYTHKSGGQRIPIHVTHPRFQWRMHE